MIGRLLFLVLAVLLIANGRLIAHSVDLPAPGAAQPDPQDLKAMSIEELMQIDITLAARQPEPVRTAAAAIDVVTAEEIRRSGVTTIADAIALADGVHVARFNNGTWAISARGFNTNSANKLLVMIDGRTEYSPLFSGAFWNMLDYVLADIDRIEVIRGPGATLWGANAVNGVINIVTRHARDTAGAYVALGTGNEDPALADFRYGSSSGGVAYRVYGKYAHRDAQVFDTGVPSADARRRSQIGFRVDSDSATRDTWLVKGDLFTSRDDLPDRDDGEFLGAALQAAWGRAVSSSSRVSVQSYYRREYRRVPLQLTHRIDTVDLDVQHAFAAGARHSVVWGAVARLNSDTTEPGTVAFEPVERRYSLFSVFLQDEIMIAPDRLWLIAGVKAERNAFSGVELQPNLRARLQLTPAHVLWGAVSRAVRRPTRLDVDIRAFGPTGALLVVGGGPAYEGEDLLAGEMGYRAQPTAIVALDATLFVHRYDDLRSQELPPSGPPIMVANTLQGRSWGVEMSATLQPFPTWRLHGHYTRLDVSVTRAPGSRDIGGGTTEGNDPPYHFGLRSSLDLPGRVEFDAHFRRVGALPNPAVPAYGEMNLRLGWQANDGVELAVTGQDLLHAQHPEFGGLTPRRVEFERSVRTQVTIRF
jgi:iron complex outermembrane receptor protein